MRQGVIYQLAGPVTRRPAIDARATHTPSSLRLSARELFSASRWQDVINPVLLENYGRAVDPILGVTFKRRSEMTSSDRVLAFLQLDGLDTLDQPVGADDQHAVVSSVARATILDAVGILSSRSGRTDDASRRLFSSALRTLREYWANLGERSDGQRTRRGLSLLIVRIQASLRAHSIAMRTFGASLRAVFSHSSAVVMLTAPHPPTSRPIAILSATGPAV